LIWEDHESFQHFGTYISSYGESDEIGPTTPPSTRPTSTTSTSTTSTPPSSTNSASITKNSPTPTMVAASASPTSGAPASNLSSPRNSQPTAHRQYGKPRRAHFSLNRPSFQSGSLRLDPYNSNGIIRVYEKRARPSTSPSTLLPPKRTQRPSPKMMLKPKPVTPASSRDLSKSSPDLNFQSPFVFQASGLF